MGLCLEGLNTRITSTTVQIQVTEDHQYIRLANALDWQKMSGIIMEDLKSSTLTKLWWVGRKLHLRTHLGVYVLQSLLKMTDRGIEESIQGNGVYRAFCGASVVEQWHCPDHTKIEKFRNRISASTQQQLVSHMVTTAQTLGFADPSKMDVDSTVQEAGMAYPSDAHLLTKLAYKCKKVISYITGVNGLGTPLSIDIKAIKKKAKEYFFMAKNKSKQIRRQVFEELYNIIKQEVASTVSQCMSLTSQQVQALPWNIRRTIGHIATHAQKYLQDVAHFIKTHTLKAGKILSFHLMDVACISKGKVGKDVEFGRVYQLGRIGGNFLVVLPSTSIRQDDKSSLIPMVKEHEAIFGKNVLKSMTTDKGYFTKANVLKLSPIIKELGIQCPGNVKLPTIVSQALKDRRAGIEPLIGHAKRFGLAKSKAKSDRTTLASGYRSIMGFNLHQLTRHLSGKAKVKTM